jgi:glucose/mannose-6-phosphate isomerase
LERLSRDLVERRPLVCNPAKHVAARLRGRVAVIHGAEILSEVARRWKGEFNEETKAWAFFESFPDLSHNAVVGYEFPVEVKDRIFVPMLRSSAFHPRNLLRYR